MKSLVIVESPAKCKKIEEYLGSDNYKCIASYGHIRELPDLKHIDMNNGYKPVYEPIECTVMKKRQIKILEQEISRADEVILATDDDREGEAIAWHICDLFGLSIESTKRIIFHEITKSAIQKAIKTPTKINMKIVEAQQSRQILDLLVGFKISPILWKYISANRDNTLSAGRCQTPALKIIYENQLEVEKTLQNSQKNYHITTTFTPSKIPFMLEKKSKLSTEEKENINEDQVRIFLKASPIFNHIYTCSQPIKSERSPPMPFTTSLIQQTASNELHYGVKETMRICQSLYEKGFITYMRTDSAKYSNVFLVSAKQFIIEKWGNQYLNEGRIHSLRLESGMSGEKGPGGAHEAIRPTDIKRTELDVTSNVSPAERRIYHMIWENTVASCMSSALLNVITATLTAPLEIPDHEYVYKSEMVVFPGWKIIKGEKKSMETTTFQHYEYLRNIKANSTIVFTKIEAIQYVENKGTSQHITEARLVKELEKRGIGRPSTFAMIVDKIQERGYVQKQDIPAKKDTFHDFMLENKPPYHIIENSLEREYGGEKGKLVIQPIGINVCQFLMCHFHTLLDYNYTKKMEDDLDMISLGEYSLVQLCGDCDEQIKKCTTVLKSDESAQKINVKLDEEHTFVIGRNGPVIKYKPKKEKKSKKSEIHENESLLPIKEACLKSVRKDIKIDMEKLKKGEYSLEELLEPEKEIKDPADSDSPFSRFMGHMHDKNGDIMIEKPVFVKNGKFGLYLSIGSSFKEKEKPIFISLKKLGNRALDTINWTDIEPFLTAESKILRVINENLSIRKGPKSNYVFFKTSMMKKPRFLKLTEFSKTNNPLTCDMELLYSWIKEKYSAF